MMDMNTLLQPKMKILKTQTKLKMTVKSQEMVDRFGSQNTSILPVAADITLDATTTITHEINITILVDPTESIITLEREAFSKTRWKNKMLNHQKIFFKMLKKGKLS